MRIKEMKLSRAASIMLRVCLPVICTALIYLTFKMGSELPGAEEYVYMTYPELYGYIMMSLTLLTGGALILDYSVKKR